jgi:hypothetical protein
MTNTLKLDKETPESVILALNSALTLLDNAQRLYLLRHPLAGTAATVRGRLASVRDDIVEGTLKADEEALAAKRAALLAGQPVPMPAVKNEFTEVPLEVDSDAVDALFYNEATRQFRIAFVNGGVYEYDNVPKWIVESIAVGAKSGSAGRTYNEYVKGNDAYPSRMIAAPAARAARRGR